MLHRRPFTRMELLTHTHPNTRKKTQAADLHVTGRSPDSLSPRGDGLCNVCIYPSNMLPDQSRSRGTPPPPLRNDSRCPSWPVAWGGGGGGQLITPAVVMGVLEVRPDRHASGESSNLDSHSKVWHRRRSDLNPQIRFYFELEKNKK